MKSPARISLIFSDTLMQKRYVSSVLSTCSQWTCSIKPVKPQTWFKKKNAMWRYGVSHRLTKFSSFRCPAFFCCCSSFLCLPGRREFPQWPVGVAILRNGINPRVPSTICSAVYKCTAMHKRYKTSKWLSKVTLSFEICDIGINLPFLSVNAAMKQFLPPHCVLAVCNAKKHGGNKMTFIPDS